MLRNSEPVETKLERIAEKARRDSRELLRECFARLRKDAAAGIDQVTLTCSLNCEVCL